MPCWSLWQEAGEYFTTVAKALSEVVNPTYQRDIEDIVPGCGAILQKGLEKVAVYKDETGETHAFRAACPHLVRHLPVLAVGHSGTLHLLASLTSAQHTVAAHACCCCALQLPLLWMRNQGCRMACPLGRGMALLARAVLGGVRRA